MERLSQEKLKEVLDYNEDTGIFNWKERMRDNGRRNPCSGKKAGTLHSNRYNYIRIDGKQFLAHRLAWLFAHGYFPENDIDHIDQIKDHNWLSNLREATRTCNLQNQKISIRNKSGVTGVCWYKPTGKWVARIKKK